MSQKRRKCKLVNSDYTNVDLRQFEKIIIDTINSIVPNKNPKVFKDYFSTDPLTQGEAVVLGRELSKLPALKEYGKEVTTFRLFDGKMYDSEEASVPSCLQNKINKKKRITKGGRIT